MMTACIITTYTMLNVPSVEKAPRIIHRQNAEQLKNGTGEQTMENLNAEQVKRGLERCGMNVIYSADERPHRALSSRILQATKRRILLNKRICRSGLGRWNVVSTSEETALLML